MGITLARVLGPEPFGLVAIAWLLIGLGNLIADCGLAAAIIQKKEINEVDIRLAFTMQMLVGIILTTIVICIAPVIAELYKQQDVEQVVQVMAFMFIIQATGQTSAALLRREMNFRVIQFSSIGSYFIGYVVIGLPIALIGMGVWALVYAQLTQAIINALVLNLRVRHSIKPFLKIKNTDLFSFSSGVLVSNISSWGISNIDSGLVGKVFGVTELGVYSRSMNLVVTPMNAIITAVQGVAFSAYSRTQSDISTVRQAYLSSLSYIAILLIPIYSALAVIPKTVILGVYGDAWLAAVPLLTAHALAMPVNALLAVGGPLLLGLGKSKWEAGAHFVSLGVMIIAIWGALMVSFECIAWAVFITYLFRCYLISALALRLCQGTWNSFGKAIFGPLILGVFSACVAFSINQLLGYIDMLPILRLIIVLIGVIGLCLLFLILVGKHILSQRLINQFFLFSLQLSPKFLFFSSIK